MNQVTEQQIEQKMKLFTGYLERCKLEQKDYQYDGVRWCLMKELGAHADNVIQCKGGFFADEMGLGKTIQMIGLMVTNMVRNTLIVVPPVLIDQWYAQILRTTGHKALIYRSGSKRSVGLEQLKQAPVVITTYGMVAQGHPRIDKNLLQQIEWARVIFDEAHHLRNKTIKHDSALNLLSDCKWLVTGTPVQNVKRDFYNLCRVVGLPDWYFKKPEYMFNLAKYYILKRTKRQVGLELPAIHYSKTSVEWQNEQEKKLSEAIHSALNFSQVPYTDNVIVNQLMSNMNTTLPLFLRARQCCTIPRMIMNALDDQVCNEYGEGLNSMSKLTAVANAIAQNKDNGRGKLVFCHFREEMNELVFQLKLRGLDKVAIFDGRIKHSDRHALLTAKHDALLVQINTGCEGLNLQEHYSEVYFVSPHWNPAVEAQAIGRIYRFGQQRSVRVNRFAMTGFDPQQEQPGVTLDRHVRTIQHMKKDLVREMFNQFQTHRNAIVVPPPAVEVVRHGQIRHFPVATAVAEVVNVFEAPIVEAHLVTD